MNSINAGASIGGRCGRRLGPACTEATQLPALLDDEVADAGIGAVGAGRGHRTDYCVRFCRCRDVQQDTFDLLVTAVSNRELNQAEFDRQVDLIRPLMNWDPASWSWQVRLSGSHPEHVSSVLTTLFEVARLYGATVTVRPAPAAPMEAAG
ncbi:hypothetical protein [Streptosporangium sandarakinum]|uniref:hypothetical protein n=1 Tax=Streptosporangium sandarakinum TaxID=1260955 RepID=UPI00341990B1